MSVVHRNIGANVVGSGWTGLMGLIFVPAYIYFMGIEAYALTAIFTTLLALFALLDMGLSTTLNRELATLSVREGVAAEMRDLVRTLEIPYWGIGLFVGAATIGLAPLIAYHWVQVDELHPETVSFAVKLIGCALAFQWPIALYSGGLMGLQRQVLLNVINMVMATVRGVGAVGVLWLLSPTVEAFFIWQIVVSALHVGLLWRFLWRTIPASGTRPRFQLDIVRRLWRFAAGMTGITLLGTILMQMDKIVLSRILGLDAFGYYTLASVVAHSLDRLVSPIFTAVYPRMTNLVSEKLYEQLQVLYHKSAQLVAVLLLPVSLMLIMYSREILFIWTRDHTLVEESALLVSLLVAGKVLSGLMTIPHSLQLAFGWTRLAFWGNVGAVSLQVPLLIVLSQRYGAVGAASVWFIVSLLYMVVTIPIMHVYYLRADKYRWLVDDVVKPLGAAAGVILLARLWIQESWPPWGLLLGLLVTGVLAASASALAADALGIYGRGVRMLKQCGAKWFQ